MADGRPQPTLEDHRSGRRILDPFCERRSNLSARNKRKGRVPDLSGGKRRFACLGGEDWAEDWRIRCAEVHTDNRQEPRLRSQFGREPGVRGNRQGCNQMAGELSKGVWWAARRVGLYRI